MSEQFGIQILFECSGPSNSIRSHNQVTFWNQIFLVFVFRQFFQTEYYSYSYSGSFSNWISFVFVFRLFSQNEYRWEFFLNTINILLSIDTFDEWSSPNPWKMGTWKFSKNWVGERSSLSTQPYQNYFLRQNYNSSSYTRVTSGELYGLEAVCICN